jgi:hypothetical protein
MSRFLLCLTASLTLVAACSSGTPPKGPDPAAGSISATASVDSSTADTSGAVVRVDNRAFDDMAIYVVYASQRIRLGVATGNSVTDLRVLPFVVATGPVSVRFAADPIGGTNLILTEPITVQRGDVVSLLIPR